MRSHKYFSGAFVSCIHVKELSISVTRFHLASFIFLYFLVDLFKIHSTCFRHLFLILKYPLI